tara:strand:+ start:719 stop:1363 length:645 start_codon:yes stop_codon:yes gene_type:complete
MARVNSTTKETNNNFNVANGTGAAVRAGINDIFTALRTINSASGDPSGVGNVVQFQPHIDSATNLLKICTAVSSGTGTFTTIGNITQANLGLVNAATPTMTGDVTMNSNGFLKIPVGNDSQQPGQSGQPAAAIGQLRYNSTQNRFEGYKNTGWGEIGGGAGATGGGTDQVFVETGQNVTEDYTLSAGKNAMTVSPTIANNKTITVPNNATLVIL